MKTAKQKRFAAIFAGMLCISCLSAPLAVDAESAGTAGENDTIATAEELPLNTAVSGDISAKGDVDFYQFTLPEDGLLQVSMIADWVSDFGDSYRITFYDADGNQISQDDYVHSNTQFPANGWTAGVYYLSLAPYYADYPPASTYTLTANFTPKSQWESDSAYELEPNDSFSNANALTLSAPCRGVFHNYQDTDYYTFTTDQPGKLSVTLGDETQSSGYLGWSLFLYNGDREQIGKTELTQGTASVTIPEQGFDPGTFYIQVKTNAMTNGNWSGAEQYTLTADFTPTDSTYESEPNDSTSRADVMLPNTPVSGKLSDESDVDYYKVTLDSAAQFSLCLEHALPDDLSSSGTPWTVTCYPFDEKTGTLREDKAVTLDAALGKTKTESETVLVRGGTYYVEVRHKGYGGFSDLEYTLTMQAEMLTYTKGDANADGSIDSTDVFEMMYSCAKKAVGRTDDLLEGANFLAADIDENDTLDSTDIFYEMLYIASKGAGVPVDWDSIVK